MNPYGFSRGAHFASYASVPSLFFFLLPPTPHIYTRCLCESQLGRIAEAHQYMRQEDALSGFTPPITPHPGQESAAASGGGTTGATTAGAGGASSKKQLKAAKKANATTSTGAAGASSSLKRSVGPYAAAEKDTNAWGLEDWVKAPWSPGPYPGPPPPGSSDDEDDEGPGSVKKGVWKPKGKPPPPPPRPKPLTADQTSCVPLKERYNAAVEKRAAGGVATTFHLKVPNPLAAPPWWLTTDEKPPIVDEQLFEAAAAASAWERRHMPVIKLPSADDDDDEQTAETAVPHPFPKVESPRPPALPLQPSTASAGKLTRTTRTDDRTVLTHAAFLQRSLKERYAREAEQRRKPMGFGDAVLSLRSSSSVASLASSRSLGGDSNNSIKDNAKGNGDNMSSNLSSSSSSSSGSGGGASTVITLNSTYEERQAAKAEKKRALAAKAQQKLNDKLAAARRKRAVRDAYKYGVSDGLAFQHHHILNVVDYCERQPLPMPKQVPTSASAAAAAALNALRESQAKKAADGAAAAAAAALPSVTFPDASSLSTRAQQLPASHEQGNAISTRTSTASLPPIVSPKKSKRGDKVEASASETLRALTPREDGDEATGLEEIGGATNNEPGGDLELKTGQLSGLEGGDGERLRREESSEDVVIAGEDGNSVLDDQVASLDVSVMSLGSLDESAEDQDEAGAGDGEKIGDASQDGVGSGGVSESPVVYNAPAHSLLYSS